MAHDAISLTVTVHYTFHPYAGQQLSLIRPASRADRTVTVTAPNGHDLRIPAWMLEPTARAEISSQALIKIEAWIHVLELIDADSMLKSVLDASETASTDESRPREADHGTIVATGRRRVAEPKTARRADLLDRGRRESRIERAKSGSDDPDDGECHGRGGSSTRESQR